MQLIRYKYNLYLFLIPSQIYCKKTGTGCGMFLHQQQMEKILRVKKQSRVSIAIDLVQI